MPECNPWNRCCSPQLCLRSKNESCWRLQSDEEMEMKKNGVQRRIDCGGGDKHTVLERNWKLLWGTVWIMSVLKASKAYNICSSMCTPPHELFWRTPVKVNQRKKIAVWNIGVMGSITWITFVSSSKKTQKFFLPLILSGRVGAEKFDSDVLTDFL